MNGWWGWKYVIVQLFWKYANHPIQPKASTLNSWTYDMAEYLPVSTLLCKKCKKMLLLFSFPYWRVSKNFDHQASPYVDEKSLIRLLEKLAAHTEFRTLTKGRSDHHLHNVDNYHPHHRHHHRRHRSIEHHTNLEDLLKMKNVYIHPGLPDPPMDVRVDSGPQDGTILVTWIPVTLNITTPGQKVPLMLDKDIISSLSSSMSSSSPPSRTSWS